MTRTIEQQTGARRAGPLALYEYDVLQGVTEFSFDLTAPGFLEYHTARCGGSWEWESQRLRDTITGVLSDEQIVTGPEWATSLYGYRYTRRERESTLRFIQATRRRLQDVWELYVGLRDGTIEPPEAPGEMPAPRLHTERAVKTSAPPLCVGFELGVPA